MARGRTGGRYAALVAFAVAVSTTPARATSSGADYFLLHGALRLGADLSTGTFDDARDAARACDVMPRCLGFTYKLPPRVGPASARTNASLRVHFKATRHANADGTWRAHLKPVPPEVADRNFSVGGLLLALRLHSHTAQQLRLETDPMPPHNFSWVPPLSGYKRPTRSHPGCHHLGDVTLRVQPVAERDRAAWATFSTALAGAEVDAPPVAGPLPPGVLAAHDVTPLLEYEHPSFPGECPHGSLSATLHDRDPSARGAGGAGMRGRQRVVSECLRAPLRGRADFALGLRAVRSWERAAPDGGPGDGALVLRLNLSVPSDARAGVRIGGLGFALPADDNWGGMKLEQIAPTVSFVDPHIGSHRGYAEWIRAVGNASMLAVAHTAATRLEAWRPLLEDCAYNSQISEWTVLSEAWAAEWATNRQAPALELAENLARTGVWPHPRSPWPELHRAQTYLSAAPPKPWNPPTSAVLQPGEAASFALRLMLVPDAPGSTPPTPPPAAAAAEPPPGPPAPRRLARDAALAALAQPVVHAVPGFVIGTDMRSAALFVRPPPGSAIVAVDVAPGGVLSVALGGEPHAAPPGVGAAAQRLAVRGLARGAARVSVRFEDGTELAVHYRVLPPSTEQLDALGAHWAHTAWLPRSYPDPFGRSASVMPFDREAQRWVLEDARAYNVGLSDDAGAAQNLGLAMKVAVAPVASEVARLDEYVDSTLLGTKPDTARPPLRSLQDPDTHAVRMTLFYYNQTHWPHDYTEENKCRVPLRGPVWCMVRARARAASALERPHATHARWCHANPRARTPPRLRTTSLARTRSRLRARARARARAQTEKLANATYRAFNYPHQTAVYWALYRVARYYDRVRTAHGWAWYLEHAFLTARRVHRPSVGLMVGTVFRELLVALRAEGGANATIAAWAEELDGNMRHRAEHWSTLAFPYGSEFNFDTTGQEEVYVWLRHYGHDAAAARTLDAVLSFMRSSATWAYHGGARSLGDLGNNGKVFVTRGTERGLMHYRAGLNMIPCVEAYRAAPDEANLVLLEIAAGALGGALASIDERGAPSLMFHASPFVLDHDPHSGDFGLGFFGHALQAGAFVVRHSTAGWLCYFCDIAPPNRTSAVVRAEPRDSVRRRVYVQPLGLQLEAMAGRIRAVAFDLRARWLRVELEPPIAEARAAGGGAPFTTYALRVAKEGAHLPGAGLKVDSPADARLVRGVYHFKPPDAEGRVGGVVHMRWQR